ncbi:MAG: hypothetical protein Q4G27_03560 [Flavobacteriaceae bacterium]|nr:hypothetical protein [Flavobacteriaceae bacterium]
MKITIISWDNLGYVSMIEQEMKRQGHVVNHLKMNEMAYAYPDFKSKVKNLVTKTLFNYNFKREILAKRLQIELNKISQQDVILIISADWLPKNFVDALRIKATRMIAWFYDAAANYPRIPYMVSAFDQAYTFEPSDAEKFNMEFLPNFNPYNEVQDRKTAEKYLFHVSSERKGRKNMLINLAKQLEKADVLYDIYLISHANEENSWIHIQKEGITLNQVHAKLKKASYQIDIQRERQLGVSFRIFEAMGMQQKIITTNTAIAAYDFFDSNNILILNPNQIEIPESFFELKYRPIAKEIYNKYTIENWVKKILN